MKLELVTQMVSPILECMLAILKCTLKEVRSIILKILHKNYSHVKEIKGYRYYDRIDSNQPDCNSVVIPHYFNIDDFDYSENKKDHLLFIGRLNTGKGIDIAAEAAKRAGVKLVIAGPGDINSLNLSGNIEYVGHADI